MRTWTALALIGLLALAAVASAEPEKPVPDEKNGPEGARDKVRESHERSFGKADTDQDGALSKDEYKAFFRASLQKMKTVSTQAVEESDKIRGDIFDRLDGDKDGKLTKEEWHGQGQDRQMRGREQADKEAMRKRHRSPFRGTPQEKAAEFAKADTDQSKTLSADEFATYMAEQSPRHKRGDKVRSVAEERVQEHEAKFAEKQASRNKAIFKRFDVNADGQLTEEEFLYPKSGGRGGKESRQKAQMKEARARRGAGSGELDDTKDA